MNNHETLGKWCGCIICERVLLCILQKYYRMSLNEVVCKAARKSSKIYYELLGLEKLVGKATQREEPGGLARVSADQTKPKTLGNHYCLIWNL